MKETIIKKEVRIQAPVQKVWDSLADFGNVSRMSPNIKNSYLTSEKQQGIGTTRHCDFVSMGAQVEERIVAWDEGQYMKIDIYEVKNMPMVGGMEAEFSLKPEGDTTVLTGTFQYGMTNWLGNFMNSLTMKRMNEKAWVSFLAGIKHHVETGEEVGKQTALDSSSVTG